jgi:GxxExxY protein
MENEMLNSGNEFLRKPSLTHVMLRVPLHYKGEPLNKDYVIHILIENEIILELKALESILPVHEAQLISYLRLANKRPGFLINFNIPLLKHGFRRFVHNL